MLEEGGGGGEKVFLVFARFGHFWVILAIFGVSGYLWGFVGDLKYVWLQQKEGIVTLRVAGLAVPVCKGLSTVVRRPTYAVLSRNQFCRKLRAHGRGGSQKVTSDDKGEGGGLATPRK